MKKIKYVILITTLLCTIIEVKSDQYDNWGQSNGGNQATRNSILKNINKDNIKKLVKTWEYNSNDRALYDTVQTTPIYINNLIITATINGNIIALNPINGKEVWKAKLPMHSARRGMTSFGENIYITSPGETYELNSKNGKIKRKFNAGSKVPPIIYKEKIYIAQSIGGIVAFNLLTGNKIWTNNLTINDASARIWSGFSYDERNNILFAVTSNYNLYQTIETGYSNSIVAINGDSGEIIWNHKEIKNDWRDLDMVAPPIVAQGLVNKQYNDFVIALSKTSAIYIFDVKNGNLLNYNKNSKNNDKLKILDNIYIPQSIDFSIEDIDSRSAENNEYIKNLMKKENDKSNIISTNKPHAFYGIHGGAEWFGGAYNSKNSILVVPMNRYPWFIRSEFTNNSSIKINSFIDKNLLNYQNHCAICHGTDLEGLSGSKIINADNSYIPSLIGKINNNVTKKFLNKEEFDENHKFSLTEYELSRYSKLNFNSTGSLSDIMYEIMKNVKYILRKLFYKLIYSNKIITELNSNELNKISEELIQINNKIISNGGYTERRFFQPILDKDYLPVTKPPWGELVAYNINESKLIWRIPFGFEKSFDNTHTYNGSRNFGGVLMTDSDILFANGTTDEFARAYDILNGTMIWESKLPFSGSSPPMTFIHNECQYIIFNATGGRFKGFKGSGDATVAYKLSDC